MWMFWLFSLILSTVSCESLQWTRINAKFQSAFVSGSLNESISLATYPATSHLQCTAKCNSLNGVSLYYLQNEKICHCNNETDDTLVTTAENTGIRYTVITERVKIFKSPTHPKIHVEPVPIDCLELYTLGYQQDGVYQIRPIGGVAVDTWCDMTNNGWTVIQRRQDGSEDFYRTMQEYIDGFGNRSGEYWLGLENMHKLTQSTNTILRIDMETFADLNETGYVEYSDFVIDSAEMDYALHMSGYIGGCGDSLFDRHNGMPFTTHDSFNYASCAQDYKGAWWYGLTPSTCHYSNLNGLYHSGSHTSFADGINWNHCWGYNYSLKTTVMKIRRNV